jgi:glycine/D-amino acid oxidase-like deaminating enzyme
MDMITCDVLIIGAGYAGLSAARRLQQLQGKNDIAVIDATRVGHGPAGRNSGFMIDLPHTLSSDQYASSLDRDLGQIKLNRIAINFATTAAEEFNFPDGAVDSCGRINGAADANGLKHNRSYAAHLALLGEPFEELDAKNMKDITGSQFYSTGLYMPGATLLQPAQYIRALADAVTDKNRAGKTVIYENTPALEIKRVGQDWQVKTPQGVISAAAIILAVNGHAESFGFFKNRLMHIFTYASMTEAMSDEQIKALGGGRRWGITPSDPMGSSLRRISGVGGDRIIIRNRWSFDPSMEVSLGRVARYGRDQDKGFARRFPMLKDLKMEYRWAGRLCLSYNAVAAFGEVADGIIAACCQNGLGTAKGTLAGIAAAEMLCKTDSPLTKEMLAADMPARLPPKPLAWLGANAIIKWREFKGRMEI